MGGVYEEKRATGGRPSIRADRLRATPRERELSPRHKGDDLEEGRAGEFRESGYASRLSAERTRSSAASPRLGDLAIADAPNSAARSRRSDDPHVLSIYEHAAQIACRPEVDLRDRLEDQWHRTATRHAESDDGAAVPNDPRHAAEMCDRAQIRRDAGLDRLP